jgi:hypothetical protein
MPPIQWHPDPSIFDIILSLTTISDIGCFAKRGSTGALRCHELDFYKDQSNKR